MRFERSTSSRTCARSPSCLRWSGDGLENRQSAPISSRRSSIPATTSRVRSRSAALRQAAEPDVEKSGGDPILSTGPEGEPVFTPASSRVLLCATPADIVAMRRSDPALAREWRVALRGALGGALAEGYVIAGATRGGWYVLEKQ